MARGRAAKASPARRLALSLLSERRRKESRIRDLLRKDARMEGVSAQDRSLATRLCMGTVAAYRLLSDLIDSYVSRPSALEPRVRDALVQSSYEICYLDTPDAIAVNEGVELVRAVSPKASGLANAVLRKVADDLAPRVAAAKEACEQGDASTEELALVSGIPADLVDAIVRSLGQDAAQKLALCTLEPAPTYVSALPRHDDGADVDPAALGELVSRRLQAEGLSGTASQLQGIRQLDAAAGLASTELMQQSRILVSDLCAQTIARCVCPAPDASLLEVGQGVGTKALAMGAYALTRGYSARIDGVELSANKVQEAQKRLSRAGLDGSIRSFCLDATRLADSCEGLQDTYDTVFVDAPCSGSGTLRRHPEIASAFSLDMLAGERGLCSIQRAMLRAASTRVAPGGYLSYSTCSVLCEEDEDIVEAFLAEHAGMAFSRVDVRELAACAQDENLHAFVSSHIQEDGSFKSSPYDKGPDGHFLAVMKRKS